MLQDALDATQRLDDVGPVVVEVPQLAVVPLVRPPERVVPALGVLLEERANAPSLVVGQRVPVFLEQRVDAGAAVDNEEEGEEEEEEEEEQEEQENKKELLAREKQETSTKKKKKRKKT